MSFTLGKDIGIVMAKGVIFGVLVCVTVLPSMILCCDKLIEKTKHKPLLPDIGRISDKVTERYVIYVVAFVILLFLAGDLQETITQVFTTIWTNRCRRVSSECHCEHEIKRRLQYEHHTYDPHGWLGCRF